MWLFGSPRSSCTSRFTKITGLQGFVNGFVNGFRIPPGFVGFVVYAWLRFHSRGRFNLASPAISSFYGLVCSTRFVANDGFATTVSSLVGFSRVTKLRNVTYCALRVSSLFAYRGIGYDWNSEDWHR